MDEQQRVFVTVDEKRSDVALIMVGTVDDNGKPIGSAYLVEVTTPAAANVVGRFVAHQRGLEFVPRDAPGKEQAGTGP